MSLVTLVPSALRDSSGVVDFAGWTPDLPLALQVDVTAVGGTSPSMSVFVEQTFDGVHWSAMANSPSGITATGQYRGVVEPQQPSTGTYRIRWALSGTDPEFTFSVVVHAKP